VIVAVVANDGLPLTTDAGSPFTKPAMVAVSVGFAVPYGREKLFAVTVRDARVAAVDWLSVAGT
jgi:hypothetical protein